MTTLLGVDDLKQFALPSGWDATEMLKYQLASGENYDSVITAIAAGLNVANGDMLNDPIYGGLVSVTTELGVEYGDGITAGMSERTEYSRPDVKRGTTIGHMLPLKSYDRGLGWTFDYLRKARQISIDNGIYLAIGDVKDNWQKQILTRFFSDSENLLGSSGYDVPFIQGGSGNIDYTPPPYGGATFASTHDHFDRKTTSVQGDALTAGAKHLHEHGLMAPYTAIIPETDRSTYTGLGANWVKPDMGNNFIRTDSGANWATAINIIEPFIGTYETDHGLVNVWATHRLPNNYLGLYKSEGINDTRNPLAIRYSDDFGLGAILLRGESFRQYPLENAVILHEFGVGVRNRLNGYACFFAASGSYTAPTIA